MNWPIFSAKITGFIFTETKGENNLLRRWNEEIVEDNYILFIRRDWKIFSPLKKEV